jgi:hypothetical protein
VVNLWTDRGDAVGTPRPPASLLAPRPAPATALAFHPYQLLLAVGGRDASATVHVIDGGAQPGLPPRGSLSA